MEFKLVSEFSPTGDQPQAIKELTESINDGEKFQTLLGVTGSGKTFTVANVIKKVNKPTLVLAHNKTLAAQLYSEFKQELASEAAEQELAESFAKVKVKVVPLMAAKDYQNALAELATLKQPIDNFFDNVMVMADDEAVKTNRLTLLSEIRDSFFAIADISLLQ